MELITKQFKVFEFEELSEEAKEKAINKHCDINIDFGEWHEFIKSDFREEVKKNYGLNFDDSVYFDFDRNKYLCFNKIWIEDIKKFIKGFKKDVITDKKEGLNFSYKLAKALKNDEITLNFREHRGEYNNIEINDYTEKQITNRYNSLDKLQDWFNDKIINVLLKRIMEEYYYLTSKESIINTLKANEYKFLENGEVF